MNRKRLDDRLQVSGQLTPSDIDEAAAAGIRQIINNRPDGEEAGQPASADLAARASAHGIAYYHIPISGGNFDDASVATFGDAVREAHGETLAFCRSGTRAATLWALSQAGTKPAEDILKATADAGYDLSAMRKRIGG